MARVIATPPRLERTVISVGGTSVGIPLPSRPAGSTIYPGASNCQQGAAVGQAVGALGELDTCTRPVVIGLVVLPGTSARKLAFEMVAIMNMPAGAGDRDDVTVRLIFAFALAVVPG